MASKRNAALPSASGMKAMRSPASSSVAEPLSLSSSRTKAKSSPSGSYTPPIRSTTSMEAVEPSRTVYLIVSMARGASFTGSM